MKEQIKAIRDYLTEFPKKVNELLSDKPKQELATSRLKEIEEARKPYDKWFEIYRKDSIEQGSLKEQTKAILEEVKVYRGKYPTFLQWAEENYELSPIEPPLTTQEPETPHERLLAAYYAIWKICGIMNDNAKRKELFTDELSFDQDDTLKNWEFVEEEYPAGLIIRLDEALRLIKQDLAGDAEVQTQNPDTKEIAVDLSLFYNNKKGLTKQLIEDLIACPSGVKHDHDRHGKEQPKTLKEALKSKGYLELEKNIHKDRYDKKIKLKNNVRITKK